REPGLCTPEGNVACRLSIRHQRLPAPPNAPRVLRPHGFFPDSLQRLLGLSRSDALPNRRQQKSGLAPTLSCDPFPSEGRVYSPCTVKARYAGIWHWVHLDFVDRDAKIEIQTERLPGSDRPEANVFPLRRTVANQTHVRPSYELEVFSHQYFTLARRLLSLIQ